MLKQTPVGLPWALLLLIGKNPPMISAFVQSIVTDAAGEIMTELLSPLQFKFRPPQTKKHSKEQQEQNIKAKAGSFLVTYSWNACFRTEVMNTSIVLSWRSSGWKQIPSLTSTALEINCQLIAAALTAGEF